MGTGVGFVVNVPDGGVGPGPGCPEDVGEGEAVDGCGVDVPEGGDGRTSGRPPVGGVGVGAGCVVDSPDDGDGLVSGRPPGVVDGTAIGEGVGLNALMGGKVPAIVGMGDGPSSMSLSLSLSTNGRKSILSSAKATPATKPPTTSRSVTAQQINQQAAMRFHDPLFFAFLPFLLLRFAWVAPSTAPSSRPRGA